MGIAASINEVRSNGHIGESTQNNKAVKEESLEQNFLNMLLTQLKNQDPTNPMQNHEMTSQIAQIKTVQGIESLNQTVNNLAGKIESKKYLDAIALKDKDVMFRGNSITLGQMTAEGRDNTLSQPFGFELFSPAQQIMLTIEDKQGNVVQHIEEDLPMSAGVYHYRWNGEGLDGSVHPPGKYTFSITAKNENGVIATVPLMHGRVSSVSNNAQGAQLAVGFNKTISLDEVREIL